MAKIIFVYRSNEEMNVKICKRQLAIGGENLVMLMDLNAKGLVFDHPDVKGRELELFTEKYKILSKEELKKSLEVSTNEFTSVLSQTVDCVGCRRSVERLFLQLKISGHPTLDPIVINKQGILSISNDKLKTPKDVCTLLSKHDILLNSLLEQQPRNKKSSRCSLHSLDSFRSRPFSEMWRDVWDCMKEQCKEEVTVIETKDLQATLDGYLKKHKFCPECRTKVDKAYSLLVSESNATKEKGYVAALYSGIKRCLAEKHIHLQTKTDYIDSLIRRAEPELNGSISRHRERHAKTLEIAQEEVLTCIGMCIYERLRKIHVYLREEENACQVLGAVAVHSLSRNFDTAVEKKRGISNLELLYEEISREEKLKEQKKEQKKLKKRKKKERKNLVLLSSTSACLLATSCESEPVPQKCVCSSIDDDDDSDEEATDSADEYQIVLCNGSAPLIKTVPSSAASTKCNNPVVIDSMEVSGVKEEPVSIVSSCHSCDNNSSSSSSSNSCTTKASLNGGYVSSVEQHHNNRHHHHHHEGSCSSILSSGGNSRTSSIASSSPESSEVSCSDGFCNHDQSNHNPNTSSSSSNNNNNHSNNKNFQPSHGKGSCCRADGSDCVDKRNGHGLGLGGFNTGGNGFTLSLEQMLEDDSQSDDDNIHGNYIPDELIRKFKSRNNQIQQEREELRQKLIKNFNQLCINQRKAQNSKII